jgi:type VI secretion system protein
MAFARTLLERLEAPASGADREIARNPDEVMASIQRHLQRMLNSRRGNAPAAPDFGTSDFSEFYRGLDSIETFQAEIRESIRLYEPRLADVRVRFTPVEDQPYRLHFEVEARIVGEDGDVPAVFRTVLQDGEMKVFKG